MVHNEFIVRSGSLIDSIQDLVHDYHIDMVLMGTPAAGEETGSEALPFLQAMLNCFNCPVLLVPPHTDI